MSDMMLATGYAGRGSRAPVESPLKLTPEVGALLAVLAGARYQEAVLRGRVFGGMTAVTGVAPGTAVGTTSAFSLFNPSASAVNLVILKACMGYVSGTLGAGMVHWVANTNPAAAVTTGTAINPVNMLLGGGSAAMGKPLTTATLPATPTVVRPFVNLQAFVGTLTNNPFAVIEEVDGEIIVGPGCTISLEATAGAGTSPLVCYGIVWEEVPVS